MDSYNRAKEILLENKETLNDLADELIKKETLSREEILKVLSKVKSRKSKRVERVSAKRGISGTTGRKGSVVKKKVTKSVDKKR